MNSKRGFTLVELMISISILSMLMLSGSYVYRTIALSWDKELGSFSQQFDDTLGFEHVRTLMQGTSPYVLLDADKPTPIPTIMFVGAAKSVFGVSTTGLSGEQFPEVFRLSAVRNEAGKFDLVYQSATLRDTAIIHTHQNIDFTMSKTLLKDLDDVEFNFYGWPSFIVKHHESTISLPDPSVKKNWFSNYSGIDKQLLPDTVRLSVVRGQRRIDLNVSLTPFSDELLIYYLGVVEDV